MKVLTWLMTLGLVTTVPAYALSQTETTDQPIQTSVREDRYETRRKEIQDDVYKGELTQDEADYRKDNMYEHYENCDRNGRHRNGHMGYGYERSQTRGYGRGHCRGN